MVLPLSIVPYATVSSLLCDSMPVITVCMTDKKVSVNNWKLAWYYGLSNYPVTTIINNDRSTAVNALRENSRYYRPLA